MGHERDEPRDRRRARLSLEGRKVLDELERSSEAFEPPSEEVRARIEALPPSERKELVSVFGAMALEMAERQRENRQRAVLAASAAEAIREAQERESRGEASGPGHDARVRPGDTRAIAQTF